MQRCQRSLRLQREMHGLLARPRRLACRDGRPDALRARLVAQARSRGRRARRGGRRSGCRSRRRVLLAFLGVMTYGLTSASSTVLAAQLALDHLKCVRLVSTWRRPSTRCRPVREWAQHYHWTPRIPAPPPARKASLVGVRRCLYGHGHLAHLLYDVDGHTVSLFVMPRSDYPAGVAPARHDFLGQHAEVWASGDQSFAIVGDVAPATLATLAAEFRRPSRRGRRQRPPAGLALSSAGAVS